MKDQVDAIAGTKAKKVMIFNLQEDAIAGEFAGNSAADHLNLILSHMPTLKIDIAVADRSVAKAGGALSKLVTELGGELVLGDFSHENGKNHHDIEKLATTFSHIFL
jgi:hypothetical protein